MAPTTIAALARPGTAPLFDLFDGYRPQDVLAASERARAAGWEPDLVSAALTQLRLRARAEADLGPQAHGMFFTDVGLQQASRWVVAQHHAARFVTAGVQSVADLGCGLGVDARAFAAAGLTVTAIERDPETAAAARANLAPWPDARVIEGDARQLADGDPARLGAGLDAAYLDPARRTADGRRVLDPRQAEPPLSFVVELAGRLDTVAAKVAPGLDHALVPDEASAEWVSVNGQLVEAALWFGRGRSPDRVGAYVLRTDPDGTARTEYMAGDPSVVPDTGPVGTFLLEADDALTRARALGPLAQRLDARLLDPTIAYLSTDTEPSPSPLYSRYRVLEVMPFSLKGLRAYLRERGVGALTVKKRGTAVEPEELRRRMRLQGKASATVVLTRVAGRQSVLVVEPLATEAPETP